ncbi:MAG: hypothetical protein AAF063_16340 [Cyanobacteria bacterium J06643_5]
MTDLVGWKAPILNKQFLTASEYNQLPMLDRQSLLVLYLVS